MSLTKKVTHTLSAAALMLLSLTPHTGVCVPNVVLPNSNHFNPVIQDLVDQTSTGNIEEIQSLLKGVGETLAKSDDTLVDSREFLQAFLNAINTRFGISLTLSDIVQLTKESIHELPIPKAEMEEYLMDLDWIEQGADQREHVNPKRFCGAKQGKHKHGPGVWGWLIVATVTAGAVIICVVNPGATTAVVAGALEVGKLVLDKKN